ncbi:hypothetical protein DJ021_07990 [Phenylobacterium hankyongense]|uniref:Peptidase n=1 Tax=Phenylobacterium hankyongense TaxID=1813876 RepID=A0A328AYS6_9CAUL|nr:hypothetical protein [Phenylobacterium hankyongense]RAK59747.1 hypothetical protein DJ021_07990 [Phenylobacterium hankyongense]
MTRTFRSATVLMASSALALTLSACKIDNRPLLARDAAAGPAYGGLPAPGPMDLAYAPPAPVAAYAPPADRYAYARRAYGVDRAVYDAPPAYGFAYGDEQPWAWQTADDSLLYAEPIDNGYRSYYYEPGQDYPYFVRDGSYGYGYGQDGALIALYDAAGVLLSGDRYGQAAPLAGRYWARGYDLRRTSLRAPRIAVDEGRWRERRPQFARAQAAWIGAAQAQPGWRDQGGGERDRPAPQFAAAYGPRGHGGHHGGEGPAPQSMAQGQPQWNGGGHGRGHGGGDGGGPAPQQIAQAQPPRGHGGGDHGGGGHGRNGGGAPQQPQGGGGHGGGDQGHGHGGGDKGHGGGGGGGGGDHGGGHDHKR